MLGALTFENFCAVSDIRDMDLTIYDTQPGQVWGAAQATQFSKVLYIGTLCIKYTRHLTVENGPLYQEFFSGARLDNQVCRIFFLICFWVKGGWGAVVYWACRRWLQAREHVHNGNDDDDDDNNDM
jgi:hypothetical protein